MKQEKLKQLSKCLFSKICKLIILLLLLTNPIFCESSYILEESIRECFVDCAETFFIDKTVTDSLKEDNRGDPLDNIQNDKIGVITVPKSGTFLLLKFFGLLGINGAKPYLISTENAFKQTGKLKIPQEIYTTSYSEHVEKLRRRIPVVGSLLPEQVNEIKTSKGLINLWHLPYAKSCETFISQYGSKNFILIRDPRAQVVSMALYLLSEYAYDKIFLNDVLLDLIDGKKRRYINCNAVNLRE